METELEFVRNKIKEKGFVSASKIKIELMQRNNSSKEIVKILESIIGGAFHKITYSNRYIAEHATKVLYYYNPKKQNKKPKMRKND